MAKASWGSAVRVQVKAPVNTRLSNGTPRPGTWGKMANATAKAGRGGK
jgi:hypothetical protein